MATNLDPQSVRSAFIDHLRIERGLSENTISAYSRDLSYFLSFLDEHGTAIELITSNSLVDFEVTLRGRSLSLLQRASLLL